MDLNRKTRRQMARAQPAKDLVATRTPASPFVYVGIVGGGCVRLWPEDARAFVASLTELVDQAEAVGADTPVCTLTDPGDPSLSATTEPPDEEEEPQP